MKKRRCISCGAGIEKSALYDPYMCRDCEAKSLIGDVERYHYLDKAV